MIAARGYDGVAVFAPVTVPYVRYSDRDAHWFIGAALRAMLQDAGLEKHQVDGLAVSSFSMAPDTPASLAEHFAMDLTWLTP